MPEDQFAQLKQQVRSATSYAEIMNLTKDCIIAFDQRVHLEDLCIHVFTNLLRESDDIQFAHMIRSITRDKPKWLKYIPLDDIVRQELDIRFLLAKLPRVREQEEIMV